ncbi:MAG: uroporphyrinogen-III synthase [Bacteroidota bacterium]
MSLWAKTILITRQPERAAGMVAEVERRGGRAVVFPTIQILPPTSWEECDRSLASIAGYFGIVFTSVNAVEFFYQRVEAKGSGSPELTGLRIWCIGERTREALEERGLEVSGLPERFTSASLSGMLAKHDLRGKRILLPQGNLARSELETALRTQGAIPDPVVVYRTVPAVPSGRGRVLEEIRNGGFDAVAFASPSSARNFMLIVSDLPPAELRRYTKVAAIGPTTRDALTELGVVPDIMASVSTGEGLVEAIENYLETHHEE